MGEKPSLEALLRRSPLLKVMKAQNTIHAKDQPQAIGYYVTSSIFFLTCRPQPASQPARRPPPPPPLRLPSGLCLLPFSSLHSSTPLASFAACRPPVVNRASSPPRRTTTCRLSTSSMIDGEKPSNPNLDHWGAVVTIGTNLLLPHTTLDFTTAPSSP
jgi:hypothetical protein